MAGQIRITPDQMRSRANEYRTEAENVSNVINKMDSLINALQAEFEGQASQAFINRFNELRPSFVQAQEIITDFAAKLDMTANAMEETDSSVASSI